jgi:hypothetical protein
MAHHLELLFAPNIVAVGHFEMFELFSIFYQRTCSVYKGKRADG